MNSKKKLIISLSSFAVVLLAAVIAVVAVLAATNASVKSGITITYKADEKVKASMSAHYFYSDTELDSANWLDPAISLGEVVFDQTSSLEQTISFTGFELNSTREYVLIGFMLRNTNSEEENCYASLKITDIEGGEEFNISVSEEYSYWVFDNECPSLKDNLSAFTFGDTITDFSNPVVTISDYYDVGEVDEGNPEIEYEDYSVVYLKIAKKDYASASSDASLTFNVSWELSHQR